jgi:hypothetical protein
MNDPYRPGVSARSLMKDPCDPWDVPEARLQPADDPAKLSQADLLVVEHFLNNMRLAGKQIAAAPDGPHRAEGVKLLATLDEFARVVMPVQRELVAELVETRRFLTSLGDLLGKVAGGGK